MSLAKQDFAILDKFGFDVPPVGVKFTLKRPDKVEKLADRMAFCEMLKKAQQGTKLQHDGPGPWYEAQEAFSRRPADRFHPF
jgi:uncharacterized protein (DUF169 family)